MTNSSKMDTEVVEQLWSLFERYRSATEEIKAIDEDAIKLGLGRYITTKMERIDVCGAGEWNFPMQVHALYRVIMRDLKPSDTPAA